MKIPVLFFNPVAYDSTPWVVCCNVARNLDRARFDVHVAVDERQPEGDWGEATVFRGPLASAMSGPKWRKVLGVAPLGAVMLRVAAWMRGRRIQIIHVIDNPSAMVLAYGLCRLTGARLVVHYHDSPRQYAGWQEKAKSLVGRAADVNVGVSRFRADALEVPRDKVAAVLNGTDPQRFNPTVDPKGLRAEYGIPADAFLLVEVARYWKTKRQEDFIRALALARKQEPRLRGLLIGWQDHRGVTPTGTFLDSLRALAAAEGVSDALTFATERPDIERVYAAADAVVLPSVNEPFGLAVIEGMACGRPVIGARSGGIVEIIRDGETGLLVPPKDPAALADAFLRLARDPALCSRLGAAGRDEILRGFTLRRLGEDFGALYEKVAAQGR
ncbi:MAG: glycosyltransferase family 4 protein [Deltaproteobacteria bacterium]|nr:glycosyltransferase family 4 protein [Deltaproteobacteria bacterium]